MAAQMLDLYLVEEDPAQISSHSSYHQSLQINQRCQHLLYVEFGSFISVGHGKMIGCGDGKCINYYFPKFEKGIT